MEIEKVKKLSDDKRRRLEMALWKERLRQIWIAAGVGLPILAALVFSVVFGGFDAIVETHPVSGIVEEARAADIDKGIRSGHLKVRLDTGGEVIVSAYNRALPAVGSRVTVTERKHRFQRVDWVWE